MSPVRVSLRQLLGAVRIAAVVAILALCIGTILFLVVDVREKIEEQATASSDNVQWSLSQVEVEYLRLLGALESARLTGAEGLPELRRRFDIFYSRVQTVQQGEVYAALRREPAFSGRLAGIQRALDQMIPAIDGPDAALVADLPRLTSRVGAMLDDVRNLGLQGIRSSADRADASRRAVWLTLLRVAGLTVALILTLMALAMVLFRLYRLAERQALARRETNARLEAILSSTLDAVIAMDARGVVLHFNGAAEQVFGYTRAEAIGAQMADLIVPAHLRDAHEAGMARYLRTGATRILGHGRIELQARRRDGSIFPVELSISMARTGGGEFFVSFVRDISARVAAEAELLKARDDALAGEKAKAELLAVMSHEMRTPLNGMLGTLQLIRDTDLTPKQGDYLRIMETSGQLLLHHVNDVLDISRIDAGKVEIERRPFDLDQVLIEIADSQRSLAEANGNVLAVRMEQVGNATVLGDQTRLRQILLNLVSNAIKFTRNGTVSIEVEPLGRADIFEFRVSDTGIGISEENLAKIFDDFVTLDTSYARESGGTGLGLGIAKRLARMMGGELGAESEQGEGSLFWLRLPLPVLSPDSARLRRDPAGPPRAPAPPPSRPLSILVVEDNAINRMVAQEMIAREGHEVTLAEDGEEGVGIAATRRFDLIFMDISMPGLDGVQATQAIRAGPGPNAATPIVALTAHALPDDIARFHAAGMQDALIKPIVRDQLRALLSADRARPGPRPAAPLGPVDLDPVDLDPLNSGPIDLGPVDLDMLTERCDTLGPDLASRLCNAFVSEADRLIDTLRHAETLDDAAVVALSHKIAGSSGLFGATRLHAKLGEIETAGKTGESTRMRALLADLPPIWAETRTVMLALQARHTAAPEPLPGE